jgi:hypothetical protein
MTQEHRQTRLRPSSPNQRKENGRYHLDARLQNWDAKTESGKVARGTLASGLCQDLGSLEVEGGRVEVSKHVYIMAYVERRQITGFSTYEPANRTCSTGFEPWKNTRFMERMLARQSDDHLLVRIIGFKFELVLANGTVFV